MKTRLILVAAVLGLLAGGCASTKNKQMGSIDTPSRLWFDDLAFNRNEDGMPPDWEILDIGNDPFSEYSETWDNVQSDLFDVIK